ncbi:hypothetical protein BH11BAC1_BH11BAC1_13680 [soil metagenome]
MMNSMKKKLLLPILILFLSGSEAQNLISNPGFENYSSLPGNYGEFNLAIGWGNCNGAGTPDYFNTAGTVGTYFGANFPHTGDGMGGFCPFHGSTMDFREYFDMALSTPMLVGQTYSVSFWLANGINGGYGYGCNNLGVAFSNGALIQPGTSPILLTPPVEITTIFYDTNWTQFTFLFTPIAAFDYFTIGNFRNDANTQIAQFGVNYNAVYYFVDDIVVELANQTPVVAFTSPNHICPGTCTDFTNLSQNATSYLWTFIGANPSTSTDVNPTNICYNSPGTYPVSLIGTNSFSSDTLTLNNYITVYPYPAPQGIMQSGDTLFANPGAVNYQWFYNGNIIPGATEYFYVAPQSGDYNVVGTDANGCEVEAGIFDVIAGLTPAPPMEQEGAVVFPNPVYDNLAFQIPSINSLNIGSETAIEISIYNLLGEKIYVADYREMSNVNCEHFSQGIYWLEIKSGNKIFRTKFVKSANK